MSTSDAAQPVFAAQAAFRQVLEAMAHPGSVVGVTAQWGPPPKPLHPTTYALARTLFDFETPLWLDPTLCTDEVIGALRLHCSAPLAAAPDQAAFALIGDVTAMPPLSAFCAGESAYPDRSTTLILQVESLAVDGDWRLSGPGIETLASLGVFPVPADFKAEWERNRSRFPLGVDVVFCDPASIAALPRRIRLED